MTFSRSGTQAAGLGGDLFALRSRFGRVFFPPFLSLFAFPWKTRAGGASRGTEMLMGSTDTHGSPKPLRAPLWFIWGHPGNPSGPAERSLPCAHAASARSSPAAKPRQPGPALVLLLGAREEAIRDLALATLFKQTSATEFAKPAGLPRLPGARIRAHGPTTQPGARSAEEKLRGMGQRSSPQPRMEPPGIFSGPGAKLSHPALKG